MSIPDSSGSSWLAYFIRKIVNFYQQHRLIIKLGLKALTIAIHWNFGWNRNRGRRKPRFRYPTVFRKTSVFGSETVTTLSMCTINSQVLFCLQFFFVIFPTYHYACWNDPIWKASDINTPMSMYLLWEICLKVSTIKMSLILLKKFIFITYWYSNVCYPLFIVAQ